MQPRIIPRSDHSISRKNIDPDALKVLYRLYRSGHTAFLVGGGVRDLLIGRKPKDFDVSTSARPGQLKKLFRNCWLIGRRFRLAHIHFKDHKIVEVSTFRAEPERGEGDNAESLLVRRDNTFGNPEEDAMRRDFTINGLFYDIASFSLIDYVGGVEDIESGVIRTIGDPRIRFQEDPVRMIRAIKFAARLDFSIEPETWEALCELVEEIRKCSTSRVVEEISRLLEGGAACRSIQLLKASGLLRIVLPEVWEYFYGVPAGPGLQPDSRTEDTERTAEAIEEDLLLHSDEDVDAEVQEEILGVEAPAVDEGDDVEEGDEEDEPEGDDEEDSQEADTEAAEVGIIHTAEHPMATDTVARLPYVQDDELDISGHGPDDVDVPLYPATREQIQEMEEDEEMLLEPQEGEEESNSPPIPGGTRCVPAPDRGSLLWRTLAATDLLVRSGRHLTRPTLYSALLSPLVLHSAQWLAQRDGKTISDSDVYAPSVLRPLTANPFISRRDREQVCQIIMSQRKFLRTRGAAPNFARKPYFSEALDLFEISVWATGQESTILSWWRERYPPLEKPLPPSSRIAPLEPADEEVRTGERWGRSRRRRGRGGARGGGRQGTRGEEQPRESRPQTSRSESSRSESYDDRSRRPRSDREDRYARSERSGGMRRRPSPLREGTDSAPSRVRLDSGRYLNESSDNPRRGRQRRRKPPIINR